MLSARRWRRRAALLLALAVLSILPALFSQHDDAQAQSVPRLSFSKIPVDREVDEGMTWDFRLESNRRDVVTAKFAITGTATYGTDFVFERKHQGAWQDIGDGATIGQSLDVRVRALNDGVVDDAERVTIKLIDQSSYNIAGNTGTTVTIRSVGPLPHVEFSVAAKDVPEGAGQYTVTLNASCPATVPDYWTQTSCPPHRGMEVDLRYGGTASGALDYRGAFIGKGRSRAAPTRIYFAGGEASKTFDLSIVDDSRVEPERAETIIITVREKASPSSQDYRFGTTRTHTARIVDNDGDSLSRVSLSTHPDYTRVINSAFYTYEGTPLRWVVTADPPPTAPLTVKVNVRSDRDRRGTKHHYVDDAYIKGNETRTLHTVTIPAGARSAVLSIPTIEDNLYTHHRKLLRHADGYRPGQPHQVSGRQRRKWDAARGPAQRPEQ